MREELTDGYRELVGWPDQGAWPEHELAVRQEQFRREVYEPALESAADRVAFEQGAEQALRNAAGRLHDMTSAEQALRNAAGRLHDMTPGVHMHKLTGRAARRFAMKDETFDKLADDYRSETGKQYHEYFGPARRDLDTWLESEKAGGDAFGNGLRERWEESEQQSPYQQRIRQQAAAEAAAWRAQMRDTYGDLTGRQSVLEDLQQRVGLDPHGLESAQARQSYEHGVAELRSDFTKAWSEARQEEGTPQEAARIRAELVEQTGDRWQALRENAQAREAAYQDWRSRPTWTLRYPQLDINRDTFRFSPADERTANETAPAPGGHLPQETATAPGGRQQMAQLPAQHAGQSAPHETVREQPQRSATSAAQESAPHVARESAPRVSPARVAADERAAAELDLLRDGLEVRDEAYHEFQRHLEAFPRLRNFDAVQQVGPVREWYADARTAPSADGGQVPLGGQLHEQLEERLRRADADLAARQSTRRLFGEQVESSLPPGLRPGVVSGSARVAQLRDDFHQAVVAAAGPATTASAGGLQATLQAPPEVVERFRQEFARARFDWAAAESSFHGALQARGPSGPQDQDLVLGRASWDPETRRWYRDRLDELRERYSADWAALGSAQDPAAEQGRLEEQLRQAAEGLQVRAARTVGALRAFQDHLEAGPWQPDGRWDPQLTSWYQAEKAAIAQPLRQRLGEQGPSALRDALREYDERAAALTQTARARHGMSEDFRGLLAGRPPQQVPLRSPEMARWTADQIDAARKAYVQAREAAHAQETAGRFADAPSYAAGNDWRRPAWQADQEQLHTEYGQRLEQAEEATRREEQQGAARAEFDDAFDAWAAATGHGLDAQHLHRAREQAWEDHQRPAGSDTAASGDTFAREAVRQVAMARGRAAFDDRFRAWLDRWDTPQPAAPFQVTPKIAQAVHDHAAARFEQQLDDAVATTFPAGSDTAETLNERVREAENELSTLTGPLWGAFDLRAGYLWEQSRLASELARLAGGSYRDALDQDSRALLTALDAEDPEVSQPGREAVLASARHDLDAAFTEVFGSTDSPERLPAALQELLPQWRTRYDQVVAALPAKLARQAARESAIRGVLDDVEAATESWQSAPLTSEAFRRRFDVPREVSGRVLRGLQQGITAAINDQFDRTVLGGDGPLLTRVQDWKNAHGRLTDKDQIHAWILRHHAREGALRSAGAAFEERLAAWQSDHPGQELSEPDAARARSEWDQRILNMFDTVFGIPATSPTALTGAMWEWDARLDHETRRLPEHFAFEAEAARALTAAAGSFDHLAAGHRIDEARHEAVRNDFRQDFIDALHHRWAPKPPSASWADHETAGPVDGGLPLEELQHVRAAVVQQLKRWKVNRPVDDATVARYHDRLTGVWKRKETARARGEGIALVMVSGGRLAEFPGMDVEPFAAMITDLEDAPPVGGFVVLPGGSPDTGVEPFGARWPVGREVVVGGPRFGRHPGERPAEVPVERLPEGVRAAVAGSVSKGKGKGKAVESEWFTYVRSTPYGSGPVTYQVSGAGEIRAESFGDDVPSADWVRFGDDFYHPGGAFLRGESGWLGLVGNGTVWDQPGFPADGSADYRLVPDRDTKLMYLVPVGQAAARGAKAVVIPLAGAVGVLPGSQPGAGEESRSVEESVVRALGQWLVERKSAPGGERSRGDGGVGAGVPVVLGVLPGAGGTVRWLGDADEEAQQKAVEELAAEGGKEGEFLVVALRPGEHGLPVLGGVPVLPGPVVDQLERLFAEGVWDPAMMPLRWLAVGGGWVDRDYAEEVGWLLRERGLPAAVVYADPDERLVVLPSGERPGFGAWRGSRGRGRSGPAKAAKRAYGQGLKAWRERVRLTQVELAKEAKVSEWHLGKVERGVYTPEPPTHDGLVGALQRVERAKQSGVWQAESRVLELGPAEKKEFGERVKAWRTKQMKWTQLQLASKLKVSQATISKIESGVSNLRPDDRDRLVETLRELGLPGAPSSPWDPVAAWEAVAEDWNDRIPFSTGAGGQEGGGAHIAMQQSDPLATSADKEEFGERVKAWRTKQMKWAQDQLASKLKVSQATISKIESGGYNLRPDVLGRLVETLRELGLPGAPDTAPVPDAMDVEPAPPGDLGDLELAPLAPLEFRAESPWDPVAAWEALAEDWNDRIPFSTGAGGQEGGGAHIAMQQSDPLATSADQTFAEPTDPLLEPRTLLWDASGVVRGRNLTSEPVSSLLTGLARVYEDRPGVPLKRVTTPAQERALWPDDAYVVGVESDDGRVVRTFDGQVLTAEGLAEKLAADPELPPEVHVVLVSSFVGAGYQQFIKAVAVRLRRTVWGPSGMARLQRDGTSDEHVPALIDRDALLPYGGWVSARPTDPPFVDREWTDVRDGSTFRDSEITTRPVFADGRGWFGRMDQDDDDVRSREDRMRSYFKKRRLLWFLGAAPSVIVRTEQIDPPDPAAVAVYRAHGVAGGLVVPLAGGRKGYLSARDGGDYIGGLPEVQMYRALGYRLVLDVCYGGSAGDPTQDPPPNMPPPYVDDPLEVVALGQYASNASGMETDAPSMAGGMANDAFALAVAGDGTWSRRVRFRPEPSDDELARLAREAELHTGPGVVEEATLKTMLRLVRALRGVFGLEIEDSRGVPGGRYERVLKGIGALEKLRASDVALGRFTPFRMDLWLHYAQVSGGPTRQQAHMAVLELARARWDAEPGASLGKVLQHSSVDRVLHRFSQAADDTVRAVVGSWRTVLGPADTARAFWALVRSHSYLANLPAAEVEQLGRQVLHLPHGTPWAPSDRAQLVRVIARAIAQGLDIGNPEVLAAYHLVFAGAFETSVLLLGQGDLLGFNWSGVPAPGGVNTGVVVEEVAGWGGTSFAPSLPRWAGPGQRAPFVIWTGTDPTGTRVLHLPRLAGARVADGEFQQLLWLARWLHLMPRDIPVLFLASGHGVPGPQVPEWFFQRTRRVNWSYSGLVNLIPSSFGGPLTIQVLGEPGTGAPGRWLRNGLQQPAPPGVLATASAAPGVFNADGPAPDAPTHAQTTGSQPDTAVALTEPTAPSFSSASLMRDESGVVRGRDLTEERAHRVVVGKVRRYKTHADGALELVSESDAPWGDKAFVYAAELAGRGVYGDWETLDFQAFAEKLAHDPELAKLPKDVAVVLAIPRAASGDLELQRVVKARLGREVFAPSGEGRLEYDEGLDAYFPALIDMAPDDKNVRVGDWVPSDQLAGRRPFVDREWTDEEDGSTFRDSGVDSFPLVSNQGRRFGRGSIADQLRRRETNLRNFFDLRVTEHNTFLGEREVTDGVEPTTPLPAVYVWNSHGLPGGLALIADGRRRWLGAKQGGRFLAGLPEVLELPDGYALFLEVCFSGVAGDPKRSQPMNRMVPPVDDPLEELSLAEWTADYSKRDIIAHTHYKGLSASAHVLGGTADGRLRGRTVRVRPQPLGEDLDPLAVAANLHSGSGPASEETRRVTGKLLRALRRTFGEGIEQDRGVPGGQYERLLAGMGAIETMRANDEKLRQFTPFRMELWTTLAVQVANGNALSPGHYARVLDMARQGVVHDPGLKFSAVVPGDPGLHYALAQMSALGEARVREILTWSASQPPGPGDYGRAFWALVHAARLVHSAAPDAQERVGRGVLHMADTEPWDQGRHEEFVTLAAQAAAAGLRYRFPPALAAYHLTTKGAFEDASVLRSPDGHYLGYNWSGTPAPHGLVLDTLNVAGAVVDSPWKADGWKAGGYLALWTDTDAADRVVLHLPRLSGAAIPDEEYLELLDLAPQLRNSPLREPAVFLTSGLETRQLPEDFFQSFGRPNYSFPARLTASASAPSAELTITAHPLPGDLTPPQELWKLREWNEPAPPTTGSPTTAGQSGAVMSSPEPTDPLLEPRTLLRDASGVVRGRNLTSEPVSRLLTGLARVYEVRPGVRLKRVTTPAQERAPWPDDAYVVGVDSDDGRVVRTFDGQVLTAEGLAGKLAADPELAKLPPEVHVVLVSSFVAAGYQQFIKAVAVRLRRTVWGPSDMARLQRNGTRGEHVPALIDRDALLPYGGWVSAGPTDPPFVDREWTDVLDGSTFRDSQMDTRLIFADGRGRFGRQSVADQLRGRETVLRNFFDLRVTEHRTFVGEVEVFVGEEPTTPLPAVYVWNSHGFPGGLALIADGRARLLYAKEGGRFLAGLPEVMGLPDGYALYLDVCYSDVAGDPKRIQLDNRMVPPVDDPLEELSLAEWTADYSKRDVIAHTRVSGTSASAHIHIATADGRLRGRTVRVRPQPLGEDLDALAVAANLHSGSGPASEETRRVTGKLLRALRRTFGEGIEQDRGVPGGQYERLLAGMGAIETMRANDEKLRQFTPFRMELWTTLALQVANGNALSPGHYARVLDIARQAVVHDSGLKFSADVPDPGLHYALAQMSALGEARVREILTWSASQPPGPGDYGRAFWALVHAARLVHSAAPDAQERVGRGVLHMADTEPWDQGRHEEFVTLAAQAAAAGLRYRFPPALAAYHLTTKGAFEDASVLRSPDGHYLGYNWSGTPAPHGLVLDTLNVAGAVVDSPWKADGWKAGGYLALWTDTDAADRVVLHLPRLSGAAIPDEEYLELLDLAPQLRNSPLREPAVFLTSGLETRQLPEDFFRSFGRPSYSFPARLTASASAPSAELTITAHPLPGDLTPPQELWKLREWNDPAPPTTAGQSGAVMNAL
ncbi:lonely Cys domain-containing protein, partial [Streptomyces mirabilis]|uniref:lonely Cys domain-containing protein n=1 Tax=Streptomyces mirabilis TaxID=68239 RepID=UPI0022539D03